MLRGRGGYRRRNHRSGLSRTGRSEKTF